jgi:hypothetical protein
LFPVLSSEIISHFRENNEAAGNLTKNREYDKLFPIVLFANEFPATI